MLEGRVLLSGSADPFSISSVSWTPVGPAPILNGMTPGGMATSGEVTGIAPSPTDPDLIYIATANGGVWKTTDGGTDWTPLTDDQPTLVMGSIALAPSDPSVLYAGTGNANTGTTKNEVAFNKFDGDTSRDSYAGMGVLKSADGGQTWTLLGQSTFDKLAISRIVVDPTNADTLYAATSPYSVGGPSTPSGGGVYKSTDGGQSWTNVTPPAVSGTNAVLDLDMDPSDPDILYASAGYAGQDTNGVYKTADGGQTWKQIYTFLNLEDYDVAIAPGSPGTVYADRCQDAGVEDTVVSTDGGQTWTDNSNPADAAGKVVDAGRLAPYNEMLIVDPGDPKTVYLGGTTLFVSHDAGKSWSSLGQGADGNGPASNDHAAAFDADGRLLVGTDGGLWRLTGSASGPVQWDDLNGNLDITAITGLAAVLGDPSTLYAATQRNGLVTTSGDTQWTGAQSADGGHVLVDAADPSHVYYLATHYFSLTYYNYLLLSSTDGLDGMVDVGPKISGMGSGAPGFTLDPNDSDRLLVGTDLINVGIYNPISKMLDWSTLSTPGQNGWPTGGVVTNIAVASSDSSTIYATVSGVVYETADNGSDWTKASVPGDRVSQVIIGPDDPLSAYAVRDSASGGQVFETTDGGQTWTDISGNLPGIAAESIVEIPKSGGGHLLAVGTTSGVYVSNNEGGFWSRLRTGMPNVRVEQLLYDPTSDTLVAGTHGRGVFETAGLQALGLQVQSEPVSTSEGVQFNTAVGAFSAGGTGSRASDFSASVDWGDGSTSAATSIEANPDGSYTVYGSHQYLKSGTYTFSVTVTGPSGATDSDTGTAQVEVSGQSLSASPVSNPENDGGDTTYSGPVAFFTDTAPAPTSASDYQVTVKWFDPGSTAAVTEPITVSADPDQPVGNHFVVTSSHLLKTGTTKVQVTVTGPDGSSDSTETDIEALAPPLTIDPDFVPANPSDGVPYSGEITQFTDADPVSKGPSDYTASVAWGDGSTSTSKSGALAISKDRAGNLVVAPASGHGHVYDPGVYLMTVTVGDLTGATPVSKTYTLVVADASLSGQAFSYNASAGSPFTQILGSFTTADPRVMTVSPDTSTDPDTPPLSNYSAVVDWGDGSGPEPATVLINFDGGFVVQGTHTYAVGDKTYNYSVTFSHKLDGSDPPQVAPASTTVTGSVAVASSPFSVVPADLSGVSMTEGQVFNGSVATISTPNLLVQPGDFTASVHWGDGSTSPAGLVKDPATGVVFVVGTHLYSSWGTYPLKVSVTGPGSRISSAADSLSVGASALQASGSPVSVQARTAEAALKMASFSMVQKNAQGSPGEFSARIGWGDGSDSAGKVVSDGQGGFVVLGSHEYTNSGSYPVQVSITGQGGSSVSVSTSASVSLNLHAISGGLKGGGPGLIAYNTPTFTGLAEPGATVTVYVVPLAHPSFVPVGTTTADAAGAWSVQASALGDGLYAVTASARTASGDLSSPMTALMPSGASGYLAVDTRGPTVQGVQVDPRTGMVRITFHDAVTGLSASSLMNPEDYSLSVLTRRGPRPLPVRGLSAEPSSPGSMTVAFQGLPSRRASGTYVLGISASRVTDRAGNGLDVSMAYTPFPSIYGTKGQDFQAKFSVSGQRVSRLVPYVPQMEITAADRLHRFLLRRRLQG